MHVIVVEHIFWGFPGMFARTRLGCSTLYAPKKCQALVKSLNKKTLSRQVRSGKGQKDRFPLIQLSLLCGWKLKTCAIFNRACSTIHRTCAINHGSCSRRPTSMDHMVHGTGDMVHKARPKLCRTGSMADKRYSLDHTSCAGDHRTCSLIQSVCSRDH